MPATQTVGRRLLLGVLLSLLAAVCLLHAARAEQQSAGRLAGRLFKRSALSDDADRLIRQGGGGADANNIGQLIDLVERNNADECLARLICELAQNGKSHGEPGNRLAQSLLRFRQNRHPRARRFMEAVTQGLRAKSGQDCLGLHPRCAYQASELISVGNKLLRNK